MYLVSTRVEPEVPKNNKVYVESGAAKITSLFLHWEQSHVFS